MFFSQLRLANEKYAWWQSLDFTFGNKRNKNQELVDVAPKSYAKNDRKDWLSKEKYAWQSLTFVFEIKRNKNQEIVDAAPESNAQNDR